MPPFHLPQNKCYGSLNMRNSTTPTGFLILQKYIFLNLKKKKIYSNFFFLEIKKVGAGGKSGARADENQEC